MRSVIATAHSSPMRERLDVLVGAHEARSVSGSKRLSVWATKAQARPNTRGIAGQRTVAQLGQLAIEARRQVGADLADLLFDEMVVVEQPFRGRRDRPAFAGGLGDAAVGVEQDALVVAQAGDERPARCRRRGNRLVGGQALGMLLEPLDAEQLAADGLFVIPRESRSGAPKARRTSDFKGSLPFRH